MRKILLILSLLFTSLVPGLSIAAADEDILSLEWLDLIPESERSNFNHLGMPQVQDHSGDAAAQTKIGAVRPELNGSMVKIPGFVIPLEGDENVITEFLLVPFLGACIHVPPPPPNQIIYVRFKEGAPVQQLWDVVYIIGTLKTENVMTDSLEAESAYTIEGIALEEYDDM
ncbi:DUF3299 domain-containing protein [Vibrio sp. JC009]|uniref:DUF3299 domain-containing protein n=1 Tax=Vibrio sp. JC009 TaxID=2912314 RepID=UPI0023AFCA2E|nr:DUF3299 domain-containing protein [Vibrio sp. JC009]WED22120.1 DUF3299 domain-containing protein [Vibrio sp. JC009]